MINIALALEFATDNDAPPPTLLRVVKSAWADGSVGSIASDVWKDTCELWLVSGLGLLLVIAVTQL